MNLSVTTPIQIRFSDVDKLGHVNNAVYLSYIEYARMDFFEKVACKINWEKEGIILAQIEIDYKQPVLMHDNLFVKTWCSRIGKKSFDLSYSVFINKNEEIVEKASASSVLVCFDFENKQPIDIPTNWRNALNAKKLITDKR